MTLDETLQDNSASESRFNNEEDIEMGDESVVLVKEEKPENGEEKSGEEATNGDDDDVMILPAEEPVITEITDELEQNADASKEENQILNATDDDVMIQEPKIETQIVNDDDDEEPNATSSTCQDENSQQLIVKIKEEPKDDGYEDAINEEDPFVEVTSINEDLMLGELALWLFFFKIKKSF